jgi:hypothetical protein
MRDVPAPAPPSAYDNSKIKPSLGWYWVAGAIVVVGVATAIGIMVASAAGALGRTDDLQRVQVPGQGTIHISDTGGQVVYFEGLGPPPPGSLAVQITDPNGNAVDLHRYFGDVHYTLNQTRGFAVATFAADSTGDYAVSTKSRRSVTGAVAIGKSIFGGTLGGLLGGVLIGFISVLVGVIIAIVTGVRRRAARRRRQGPYQWQPYRPA